MKLTTTLVFLFINLLAFSQKPVSWSVTFDSASSCVFVKASIQDGWHIYSQFVSEKAGPVPTTISFEQNKTFKLKGKTREPIGKEVYDANFASDLKTFENEVIFVQKIKTSGNQNIKGSITYMACNDIGCIPPIDVPFELTIFDNQNK